MKESDSPQVRGAGIRTQLRRRRTSKESAAMTATAMGVRPEELAQTLFDVIAQFCLTAPR